MPTTSTLAVGPKSEFGSGHITATGTDEIDHEFTADRSAVIRALAYEKPATSGLTVDAVYQDGATVRLLTVGSGDAITTGQQLQGQPLPRIGQCKLVVQTSGAQSGDKKVTLILSPVDRG